MTVDEQMAFTAAVAKALLTHRKDVGITNVRQNYKGTGSQRARRQLWISFDDGRAVDVWLDADGFTVGGVTQLRMAGRFDYGDRTPLDVAADVAAKLKALKAAQ